MSLVDESKLENLYYNQLLPQLLDLETDRKEFKKIHIIAVLFFIPFILYWLQLKMMDGNLNITLIILTGLPVLPGFYFACKSKKLHDVYRSQYKKRVVSKVFNLIDSGLRYSPETGIRESAYKYSELFRKSYDDYEGEDHVKGRLDKTPFEFSELYTAYITRDRNGRRQKHTIFRGFFFVADFNKNIKSETFVLPDKAERLLGSFIGKFIQRKNFVRGELVQMENPDFEKNFVVYSNNQIDARYILTPDMMVRILNLKKRFNDIRLSFKGPCVFVAIGQKKNHFEPRLFKSGVNFKQIKEMHKTLSQLLDIVNELNLNTRIWTKD